MCLQISHLYFICNIKFLFVRIFLVCKIELVQSSIPNYSNSFFVFAFKKLMILFSWLCWFPSSLLISSMAFTAHCNNSSCSTIISICDQTSYIEDITFIQIFSLACIKHWTPSIWISFHSSCFYNLEFFFISTIN